MRINLLYNKIVADTLSDGFIESFDKNAVPKLLEKYPACKEVVLYEDYLSDGLVISGLFYCPLTLVFENGVSRAYATWRTDAKKFENAVPYAYIGKDCLNIEISDSAPNEIEKKLEGRIPFFSKNAISFKIDAQAPTKTFLSGKYSQIFVDIMRDKITRALEDEFSITAIDESSLEISFAFSPESFMEHVLDNVTYRRVLISAKACSPRDLWIKWTRLDGNGTYTVSNHVTECDVKFELCDEVPDKIREREYRYLIKSRGISAYKNAMSRKNFTEWRELVKRVVKRGEVEVLTNGEDTSTDEIVANFEDLPSVKKAFVPEKNQNESYLEIQEVCKSDTLDEQTPEAENEDAFDSEISLKLQSVLENYNIETSDVSDEDEEEINTDITELLRALLESNGEENDDTVQESFDSDEEDSELPPFDIDENPVAILEEILEENESLEEEDDAISETEGEGLENSDEYECSEDLDESENAESSDEDAEVSFEDTAPEVILDEKVPISALLDFDYDSERNNALSVKEKEISELREINSELSLRLSSAEAEIAKYKELVADYEKNAEEARIERRTLIESIDAANRREERERERLTEAAKIAVAERRADEKTVYEENADEVKLEEKTQEAQKAEALAEKSAEELGVKEALSEQEKFFVQRREELDNSPPVRYISKSADITFRHPVDPNITKRIQEIIITTVKYFGKENVYMKIKATIPDPYMVRLDFVKIPENESALLTDIIRVLGHSKIGITKVLLD